MRIETPPNDELTLLTMHTLHLLIASRTIALQKQQEDLNSLQRRVHAACINAAIQFEVNHTIRDYDFKLGALMLILNTRIEKSLNRKMHAHYLSPYVIPVAAAALTSSPSSTHRFLTGPLLRSASFLTLRKPQSHCRLNHILLLPTHIFFKNLSASRVY